MPIPPHLSAARQADYPSAQRFALVRIAEIVNEAHGWRWHAKNAWLATEVGAARTTVSRWMRDFVTDGWLEVIGDTHGGRSRATNYRWIRTGQSVALDDTINAAKVSHSDAKVSHSSAQSVALDDTQGGGMSRKRERAAQQRLSIDDPVEWRPAPSRIALAAKRGLSADQIEETIIDVNLEGLTGSGASRRWADLIRWRAQDNKQARWRRGEAPDVIVNAQPEPYEPTEVDDALPRDESARRVADLRRDRG